MRTNHSFWQFPILILGFAVGSLGIYLSVRAGLGTSPWTVFHVGLANHLPLTVGQITQLTGLVIILLSYLLGIKARIGTFLNMFFIGFFYDVWDCLGLFPAPSSMVFQFLYLLAGVVLLGLGSGIYINARLGAGPRDGLMLGLHQQLGWSIRAVRIAIELTVLVLGGLLGGPVGIGTLVFALTVGPTVQFSLQFFARLFRPLFQSPREITQVNSGK